MRADGSTAGGCWIYAGIYPDGVNKSARRSPDGGGGVTQSEWGWVWPADRRILYNRASADPDGKPWSERKRYLWWDADQQRWVGPDVPDFPVDRAPHARPDPSLGGADALAGDDPFIMQSDGKGWLFAPTGLVDGPLPAHYEPQESPVTNALYPQQQAPARVLFAREDNLDAPSGDSPGCRRLPVRVHHLPADRAPHGGRDEPLVAVPRRTAAGDVLRGLPGSWRPNGGWSTRAGRRSSRRGRRSRPGCWSPTGCKPMRINGRDVHQIGPAVPLGRRKRRGGHRRRRQRPARGDPRPEHAHPGVQGRCPATSSPAADRTART